MTSTAYKYKFYVYEILDCNRDVIYVGKGKNKRMQASMYERGGSYCIEVARFEKEQDAFDYEVERIALYQKDQLLNATKGGDGGRESIECDMKWSETKTAILNAYECIKISKRGISQRLANTRLEIMAEEFIAKCKKIFGSEKVYQLLMVN